MNEDTLTDILTLLAIVTVFLLGSFVIVRVVREGLYGPSEYATVNTLDDGRSWVCYSKRTEWKGEVENHCVKVEEIIDGGGN